MPEFISVNGPDNAGKTTQLKQLAARWDGFQMLGAVHEHDPEPWERVASDDYASWWFEKSTTVELTAMLVKGHVRRAAARRPEHTGLLDRGLPMLTAVAAATSVVKDGLSTDEALRTIREITAPLPTPAETSVLLLPSLDPHRSYAITSDRENRPWTGIYPAYQRHLHAILRRQAEEGVYDLVVDCEHHDLAEVHRRITTGLGLPLPSHDL
ncbi:conserved hypothetical protein [Actinacidiphila bryophytorum]|uniref:Thymidylate kinase n=2 Tax=Actinacidiphila bryophytorum TaxID=1436133 RepID=A0A9W4H1N2_9ACTN|nr:conserved hypothetical protein [Actinacidiphila bryophytorum]